MDQAPSIAAQVLITVIPIVGIVMGGVVAFFYILWHHRRTVLLIKSGQYRRPEFQLSAFCLLAGLLLSTVGLSLTVILYILEGKGYGLLGGIIPLSMGVGLLAYYGVRRGERSP